MAKLQDYQKRFVAEYYQLEERVIKLRSLIAKAHAGELEFALICPIVLLTYQLDFMTDYLKMLIIRSFKEQIELSYSDEIRDIYLTAITDDQMKNYE